MTIRKGESWGTPSELVADAIVCDTDADVAAALVPPDGLPSVGADGEIAARLLERWAATTVALTGGDLFRTLGGQPGPARWLSGAAVAFPIDLLWVELDGRPRLAVAHVVARDGNWWAGPTLVAMNAAFVGTYYLGPRAHPGDGRVDVTEGRLPRGQRRRGRTRMASGSHVPHPDLVEARVAGFERTFTPPRRVRVDGLDLGAVGSLRVRVVPDAFTAIV